MKKEKHNQQEYDQPLLCQVLPTAKKQKVKHFMYTATLLGILYSGTMMTNGDITTASLSLSCSTGLWCIGNAAATTDIKYRQRLTLYQGCTLLAGNSFLLLNTLLPDPLILTTTTFCAGNMFYLNHVFHQEKKRFTLTKKNQQR